MHRSREECLSTFILWDVPRPPGMSYRGMPNNHPTRHTGPPEPDRRLFCAKVKTSAAAHSACETTGHEPKLASSGIRAMSRSLDGGLGHREGDDRGQGHRDDHGQGS